MGKKASKNKEDQTASPFLSPQELSDRYRGKIKIKTLANWRTDGIGPKFEKIGGAVLYRLDDVIEWEQRTNFGAKEKQKENQI